MTFHKGGGVGPSRLACGHIRFDGSAGPGIGAIKQAPCPAEVTGSATATGLRKIARGLGWEHTRELGDRCPAHRVTATRSSRLPRQGRG